jgi:hypothetical protein
VHKNLWTLVVQLRRLSVPGLSASFPGCEGRRILAFSRDRIGRPVIPRKPASVRPRVRTGVVYVARYVKTLVFVGVLAVRDCVLGVKELSRIWQIETDTVWNIAD